MIYTWLFAESDVHVVSLDVKGNMYQVVVWSKPAHFTVESFETGSPAMAEEVFRKRVLDYRCGDIQHTQVELPANIY